MTDILVKLFVKDNKNVGDPKVRSSYGLMSSIVGILVNVLLFAGKFLVGTLFASVAIIADTFNNLSDAGTSVISLITFRISRKPADSDHPFGHARIEYVASMIVSFLILLIGFELCKDSIGSILSPAVVNTDILAMIVLGGAILFKFWLFLFYHKIGTKINSSVLRAASQDSLNDVISTSAVLVSTIIIRFTHFYMLDGIVGAVVAVFILFAGIGILKENMNSILGEAPVNEIVENVKQVVFQFPEALGIHDMIIHDYGPGHTLASLHVEVDGSKNIFELHDTIDNIERQIQETLGIGCTIHMDPIVVGDQAVDALREQVKALVHDFNPTMNTHDFRYVDGVTHQNLIFDIEVPFEVKLTNQEIIAEIAERVKTICPTYLCVITIDRVSGK
jgi:cation diffusion facilitator family transporter